MKDTIEKSYYTFFCDEAGNSGSNYLDVNQPFYITGGWLIPNSLINNKEFSEMIAKLLDKTGELHSKNIVKSPKGRFKLRLIIHSLMYEFKLLPVLCISEKKYAIAAKIIETLLDPEYNELVSYDITWDSLEKSKQYYADKIYELNNEILENFAKAYKTGDVPLMKASISVISNQFEENNEHKLLKNIYGADKDIDENLTLEHRIAIESEHKVMGSLNLPMFVVVLNMLEMLGFQRKMRLSIMHDNILEFKQGYLNYFNMMKKVTRYEHIHVRDQVIPVGFKYIDSLDFDDSAKNIYIQCADVLVCSVNRCICEFMKGATMDQSTSELWKTVLPILFCWENPKLCHFMVSGDLTMKILQSFNRN